MKKIFIIIISLIICKSDILAQNKWKVGFKLSPSISKYIYSNDYNNVGETKYGIGLSTGVNFYRLYGKNLMLKTGIYYNLKNYQTNTTIDNEYVSFNRKSSLLTIPLGFQYNFIIKQHHFFINTGAELSWFYKSVDKIDNESYTNHYNYWNPVTELFFGLGYMYKFKKKYTFFVNPEYSPKIFTEDYSTFRLNFGVIFNY